MTLILGAGLAGLSVSWHLGHENCLLLEQRPHAFGHIHSRQRDGFTWDEGPHVSFTKHEYVRQLFARSVGGKFEEFEVRAGNYFRGSWIDHPAQTSLHQLPEPLRSECLESFLATRRSAGLAPPPRHYAEWLEQAFGPRFAQTLPAAYTRKYWTVPADELTTAWTGPRVLNPSVEDVVAGAKGPLDRSRYYITRVRYPSLGGYESFARELGRGARIEFGAEVTGIDLVERKVRTSSGAEFGFSRLVNTLPLPAFVRTCAQATCQVLEAAEALACTRLLLVNATAPHLARRPETWFYVYDEEKLATRVNFTEHLSPSNAPRGTTGVQTEVYFSRHSPQNEPAPAIAAKVVRELVEIGVIDRDDLERGRVASRVIDVPWANVIFNHDREAALELILGWLEQFGLARESDELLPGCDWDARPASAPGAICLAGRFGQWKYFWTDDCVLRGRALAR